VSSYGYSLGIDGIVDVNSIAWLGGGPNSSQGLINFSSSGTSVILIWQPAQGQPTSILTGLGLGVLQASQPTTTFTGVAEGNINSKGLDVAFGGFASTDSSGSAIGGGIVGGWTCTDESTNSSDFIVIITGVDSTLVQIRFDRLLDNFNCVAR